MSKILLNCRPQAGKNCFYSALYNGLEYYGAGIDEAELYFLCTGYKSVFKMDALFNKKPHILLQYIPYTLQLEILANKLNGFTYEFNDHPDLELFLQSITKLLKENKLIIMLLKPQILNYQTLQIALNHNYHCILVHGVDLIEKKLYIADSYVLDEKGIIKSHLGLLDLEKLKDNIVGYASVHYCGLQKKTIPMLQELAAYAECGDSNHGFETLVTAIRYMKEYISVHKDYKRSDIYKLIYILKARLLCMYDYLVIYAEGGGKHNKLYEEIKRLKSQWNILFVELLMIYESGYKANVFDKVIHFAQKLTGENRQLIKEIVKANGEI